MADKFITSPYGELVQKAVDRNIPLYAHLELTYACNLDCVHCYTIPQSKEGLSKDEICRILDELADMGTLYLALTGGEIFLRPDFFEIATYAREKGFAQKESIALKRLKRLMNG